MRAETSIRRMVDALVDPVAGMGVQGVDVHHDAAERDMLTVQVDLNCWAPSMHTRDYSIVISPVRHLRTIEMIAGGMHPDEAALLTWEMRPHHADVPALRRRLGDDPKLLHDVLGHALGELLESQRVISTAARRLGIAGPLGRGGDRNGIRIDHLHANTALLDLLSETLDPAQAWRHLQDGLMHALLQADPHLDPWFMSEDNVNTGGTCTAFITRSGLAHLDVPAALGTTTAELAGARYEGDGVSLPIAIPHTVLDAAIGWPLGTIVETGRRDLDEAEIVHWSQEDDTGRCNLHLDLPVCRIGDHPGMRAPG